ncbi:zinc finger BED domain-containing protein 4 [Elysia marginata]|uniref:Zinc finger BED domain-containing protein 4 n=1 Tax=Elysia marginata TaxID=1093978 RepID=A0AAV4GRR1_9GAST|nr:zinc finger BED domain-containing protein 4 [Elysia marginata]
MAPQKNSLCWNLITLQPDRKTAVCDICKTELSYQKSGNTNLLRHLRTKHPVEFALCGEIVKPQSTVSAQISSPTQPQPHEQSPSLDSSSSAASSKDVANAPNISTDSASSSSRPTEDSSRQPTIQSTKERTSKCKSDSLRKQELDARVLDLVTVDMMPLSVVEDSGFRRLVTALDPRYEIVSKKRLNSEVLPARYQEEKARLRSMLQEVKHVSIATDCWKSRAAESFITVTVHFITKDWQLQSRVLSTMALQAPHTADNLSSTLRDVFAEWGISDKVTTCVTDNAANIALAVEKLKLRHQPCFAHTLNLAVKESIRKTADVLAAINRLKALVAFFHHSTIGTNHLKDAHRNSHSAFRKLKRELETRWNSTYEMIESYLDQHDQVTQALCLSGKQTMCITTDELDVLRKAMATLEPFYEATVELSSERHTTVAKVIPLVDILKEMVSSDDSPLAVLLHQQLQERFKTVDRRPHLHCHLTMATALDPRYKLNGFLSTDSSDRAVQMLKEVASTILLPQCSTAQEAKAAEEKPIPPPAKKPKSLLWASFDQQVEGKQHVTPNTATELEVCRHLEAESIPREANPLEYWRNHCASLPRLSLIARDVLSIPATSVPGERLFSEAGEVISAKRSSMKAKNVDMILFLNNARD